MTGNSPAMETFSATPSVALAAQWLVDGKGDPARAVFPQLRERFDLGAADAVVAIRLANTLRKGASA